MKKLLTLFAICILNAILAQNPNFENQHVQVHFLRNDLLLGQQSSGDQAWGGNGTDNFKVQINTQARGASSNTYQLKIYFKDSVSKFQVDGVAATQNPHIITLSSFKKDYEVALNGVKVLTIQSWNSNFVSSGRFEIYYYGSRVSAYSGSHTSDSLTICDQLIDLNNLKIKAYMSYFVFGEHKDVELTNRSFWYRNHDRYLEYKEPTGSLGTELFFTDHSFEIQIPLGPYLPQDPYGEIATLRIPLKVLKSPIRSITPISCLKDSVVLSTDKSKNWFYKDGRPFSKTNTILAKHPGWYSTFDVDHTNLGSCLNNTETVAIYPCDQTVVLTVLETNTNKAIPYINIYSEGQIVGVTDISGRVELPVSHIKNNNLHIKNDLYETSSILTDQYSFKKQTPYTLYATKKLDHNMAISGTSTFARPGFEFTYNIVVKNTGKSKNMGIIFVEVDPQLQVQDNIWTLNEGKYSLQTDTLESEQSKTYTLKTLVPTDIPLGNFLQTKATLFTEADLYIGDDTLKLWNIVRGSFDPNDIQAVASEPWNTEGTQISKTSDLDFTIRFQNTGTDTAFTVVIKDTIDAHLDINSYELLTTSHVVKTQIQDRTITWTFENILLPDSHINLQASNGYLSFRLKQSPSTETSIINSKASIYFDFNNPVHTNILTHHSLERKALNITESNQPIGFWAYPNPSKGVLHMVAPENIQAAELISSTGQRYPLHVASQVEMPHAKGIYIIKFVFKDGSRSAQRIVLE